MRARGLLRLWLVAVTEIALVMPTTAVQAFPTVAWERRAVGVFSAVATAPDGGAVVTGYAHWDHLFVRRYGPEGGLRWVRRWDLDVSRPHGLDVAVGADGAVYVVGGAECGGGKAAASSS